MLMTHDSSQDLEEAWSKFSSEQLYSWASAELDTVAAQDRDASAMLSSLDWDQDISSESGGRLGSAQGFGVLWSGSSIRDNIHLQTHVMQIHTMQIHVMQTHGLLFPF